MAAQEQLLSVSCLVGCLSAFCKTGSSQQLRCHFDCRNSCRRWRRRKEKRRRKREYDEDEEEEEEKEMEHNFVFKDDIHETSDVDVPMSGPRRTLWDTCRDSLC